MSDSMLESNFSEVNATSQITAANFGSSILDFPFSVGRPNCWYPSKSYFRISANIWGKTNAAANRVPLMRDGLAFASNPGGTLFSECYFQMGSTDVSKINSFVPQASSLKTRLLNSHGYLESLGKGLIYQKPNLTERITDVSTAAPDINQPSSNDIYSLSATGHFRDATMSSVSNSILTRLQLGYPADATVTITGTDTITIDRIANDLPLGRWCVGDAYSDAANAATVTAIGTNTVNQLVLTVSVVVDAAAATTNFSRARQSEGTITGVNTNFQALDVGNQISIEGLLFNIISVQSTTLLTTDNPAQVVTTTNHFAIKRDVTRSVQAKNQLNFIYQTPIGIFDLPQDHRLGAGDYRLRCVPSPTWKTSIVESVMNSAAYGTDFGIEITDVKFYYFGDKSEIPDDSYYLHLNEILVQNKPYNNSLQFSVPSSTFAITAFLQASDAGTNTKNSISAFKSALNEDLTLQTIQITYGNVTKTSTSYQSNYGANLNQLQQRYLETYTYLNNATLGITGVETFEDWMQAGPIFHFNVERDSENRATELQIITNYTTLPANSKLFIVAWYRTTTNYITKSGSIVSVNTISS